MATQGADGDGERPEVGCPAPPELAGLALFAVDLDGVVTWCSRAVERLFGHPADSVRGHDIRELLCPQDRVAVKEALAEVGAGRLWEGLLSACRGDGGHDTFAFRWELAPAAGQDAVLVVARPLAPTGLTLLSEAGARIGASLDLGQTARDVVEVAVPRFAAAASIYLLERLLVADELTHRETAGSVVLRRLAVHVANRSRASWADAAPAGEVVVYPEGSPHARCLAAGEAVSFDRVDSETAERLSRRAGGAELVAGYRAFLAVPLTARGAVLGLAVFARVGCDEPFGPHDVTVASELAARAAVCVENARLFAREQRTALALQRSLAPRTTCTPPGLDVAHRSVPAGAGIVGGDWLDIIPLPRGRAALMVGDVMGHGADAAAVMAQLRTAGRALAEMDLPPDEVLLRLDRIAQHLDDAPFGTCVYVVLDPAEHVCAIARAGHLPPVLAAPDGVTAVLEAPPGLPLGLGETNFQTTTAPVPPGAVLALYTDGLVESRRRSFETGIAALRGALATPSGELGVLCQAAVDSLRQDGEDDVTLVLARIRDAPDARGVPDGQRSPG